MSDLLKSEDLHRIGEALDRGLSGSVVWGIVPDGPGVESAGEREWVAFEHFDSFEMRRDAARRVIEELRGLGYEVSRG